MTIESLQYFYAVANGMTYMDAAEEFHISQSSLSKSIFRLEDELGIRLFDRTGHRASLTPAGKRLLTDLKEIEPGWSRLRRHIDLMRQDRKISLCAIPAITALGLPAILQDFSQENPEILLDAFGSPECSEVLEKLERGEIDMAVMHEPNPLPIHWKTRLLHDDVWVAILPLDHPLAKEKDLSFQQLLEEKFVLNMGGSKILQRITDISGYVPEKVTVTSANRESILIQVQANRGISLYYASDLSFFNLNRVSVHRISDVPCPPWIIASNIEMTKQHKRLSDFIFSYMKTVTMPDIIRKN